MSGYIPLFEISNMMLKYVSEIMEKIGMNYIGENGLRNYCKNVSCAKELKFEMFL